MQSVFKGTKTHSVWLCFMYPRLKLARDLLKDDGVIFISINDKAPQTMPKKGYDDEVAFYDSAGQR